MPTGTSPRQPERRPLTRDDLDDALALADDRGIELRRAKLPDGAGTIWCDGVLWVNTRLEMCEYARQIVDGVHEIAAAQDRERRPRLTVVDPPPRFVPDAAHLFAG